MSFSCTFHSKGLAKAHPAGGTVNAIFPCMFNGLRLGEPLFDLLVKTAKETIDDYCMSIAAELAYYFALALFPALLFVVALASYLPFNVVNDVVAALAPIAPKEVLDIIRKQLESIVSGQSNGILTIAILGPRWGT